MKFRNVIFLLICLLFSNCIIFKEVENNVSNDYLFNTYHTKKIIEPEIIKKQHFDYYKSMFRRAILENPELTDDEKELRLETLGKLEFKDNQYILFKIISPDPLLKKYQDLKFTFNDVNYYSIIDKMLNISYKNIFSYNGATIITYRYLWILKTEKSISEYKENNNNLPLYLTIEFPNGQQAKYSIDL